MSTGGMRPTRVRSVLPALQGRGVLLAAPVDAERIRRTLEAAGFAVAEADLGGLPEESPQRPDDMLDADGRPTSLRTAQDAVAQALRLPEAAGRNLDALVDSLRDLAYWWPDDRAVALLLHGAETLVESDLPGWHELTEILSAASSELWQDGGEGDRAFETVAFVHRHGVPVLAGDEVSADELTGGEISEDELTGDEVSGDQLTEDEASGDGWSS
ncbi:barstar family protein [Ornithinimicrobium sp. F0845]|uniref:barstar family protein n=1 Tax=Ornithinimicrobium sp. F0845 TaxID=2926412 RepID=UPI001FF4FF08|nr:barstar family protein [Ornithinimicrobium sp. F0845]MCK0112154.1 barstar family protein [Ornithinimicrobium sp. F0845]